MLRKKHAKHSLFPIRQSAANRRQPSLGFELLEPRLALTVVINEFLAENNTGIQDAAGHRHDWIELKNTGPGTVDVSGWYLTDDSLNLTKWQIPATAETTSFAAGTTLLIYASGNNGELGVVGNELHTNFQLSQEPGYLGLVQSNGTTISHEFNLYPQQQVDVSYGSGIGIGSTTTETLLSSGTTSTGDGSTAYFRPFNGPNSAVDDHWTDIGYVPAAGDGWSTVTDGLGFGAYSSTYLDSTVSLAGQVSGYAIMPFNVTNKAQLTSMNLELIVDNGYILFLNGREVQRERLATDYKIGNDWELNSRQNLANATLTGSPALVDLTEWLDTIVEGNNVLAIYAANHTSDTSDFLVNAKLTAGRANGSVADSYMITPTPGLPNGAGYAGVIKDTNFSHVRGFYDSPFNVTITTTEPGTTIYYTLDGSMPTQSSSSISNGGSIPISPSQSNTDSGVVTLRARAFKAGYFPTNVDTQTYIFLDDVLNQDGIGLPTYSPWGYAGADWNIDPTIVSAVGAASFKDDLKSIPTMSLVMDWEQLFGNGSTGDGHGIYTQSDGWRDKSDERYASLEYFTDGLTEQFQVDGNVEIQGHSSAVRWRDDKMSFEVKFKQPYDTLLDSATLFGNSVADGANAATRFDSLVLDAQYNYTFSVNNTSFQAPYATYVHDQVVSDLVNLAGGTAPHGRWVHLYINGMYWGVYDVHEKPTSSFAEEYYGGDKDDYLVVRNFDGIGMVHGGTHENYLQADGGLAAEAAYANLLDQVNDNLSILTEYQQVADILDIDSFIDYMVTLYYAGNYDWGKTNWFATLNSVDPNAQWHFQSWDQEHAFPNDQNGPSANGNYVQDYDHTAQVTNDFANHQFGPTGIHQMLMGSEEYRLRFSDRVQELMYNNGVLTPANAQAVWQARVDEVSSAIIGETARWGNNRVSGVDETTWATNVQYTTDHFFFANGAYQSRTDEVIDIFNHTIATGVGKTDWLADLIAPAFSQYGGEVAAGYNLTLTNPNGGGTIYYTLDGSDPRLAGGGISGSAIAYTGSISINDATRVRARVFDSSQSGTANDWSAIIDESFLLDETYPLRIVELYYHPETVEEHEFIELLNTGSTTISLDNVQIASFASTPYVFASGLTLDPGERIVVARNPTDFQTRFGTSINLAPTGYADANLSNGGESISLLGPVGELIQAFTYDDVAPWPTSPDGGGYSLEYVGPLHAGENPADAAPNDPFDVATNWRASLQIGGSPGTDGEPVLVDSADFNTDNMVNGLDFLAWQRGFGIAPAVKADGDANNDSAVDAADLAIWALQYGAAPPTVVAALATDPVSSPFAALADANIWLELPTLLSAKGGDDPLAYVAEEDRAEVLPTDEAFAQFDGRTASVSYAEDLAVDWQAGEELPSSDPGDGLAVQLDAEVVAAI